MIYPQWTRDGFGLGDTRALIGYTRYRLVGSDDESRLANGHRDDNDDGGGGGDDDDGDDDDTDDTDGGGGADAYLIFVIFSPHMQILVQFFST